MLSPIASKISEGFFFTIYPGILRNLISHLHQMHSEPHYLSAPEPAGTLSTICTAILGTSFATCTGTLRNLISHLFRNPPEPHHLSAPEPSGTFCLLSKPEPPEPYQPFGPEPYHLSGPEPSSTLFTICTAALRNLINHLHRNPPETH